MPNFNSKMFALDALTNINYTSDSITYFHIEPLGCWIIYAQLKTLIDTINTVVTSIYCNDKILIWLIHPQHTKA